jgi:meckelin
VLISVTLYFLILYKLQAEVLLMILLNEQTENFRITVILAIVGQSVALAYTVWKQCK